MELDGNNDDRKWYNFNLSWIPAITIPVCVKDNKYKIATVAAVVCVVAGCYVYKKMQKVDEIGVKAQEDTDKNSDKVTEEQEENNNDCVNK